MNRRAIEWILAGIALANALFWMYRLASFRKDRPRERNFFFGQPYWATWDLMNPSNYVPAGGRTFWIFVVSCALWWIAAVVALGA